MAKKQTGSKHKLLQSAKHKKSGKYVTQVGRSNFNKFKRIFKEAQKAPTPEIAQERLTFMLEQSNVDVTVDCMKYARGKGLKAA